MNTERIIRHIGIDAGGTTIKVIADDGTSLIELKVPAADDRKPRHLRQALKSLNSPLAHVKSVVAGVAGLAREGVPEAWEMELRNLFPAAQLQVVDDFVIAHDAENAGITVIAGTGSVVYGERKDGSLVKSVRVGGHGWEYGDQGSGAFLTCKAITETILALDYVTNNTPLTEAISKHLGSTDPAEFGTIARSRAVSEGRGFLVPFLLERAKGEDPAALNAFAQAGDWLARQAQAAAFKLRYYSCDQFNVYTVGGLWEAGNLLLDRFAECLHVYYPLASVKQPEQSPILIALARAKQLCV